MPSPKLAIVTPCLKFVATAVMATFSIWPCVPKAGSSWVMAWPGFSERLKAEISQADSVFPPPSEVLTLISQPPNEVPLNASVAFSVFAFAADTPLTAILQAILGLFCSTNLITEEFVKCVQPLPVMTTGNTVPVCPAPGETEDTAAGGLVAGAEPGSDATSADPPRLSNVT